MKLLKKIEKIIMNHKFTYIIDNIRNKNIIMNLNEYLNLDVDDVINNSITSLPDIFLDLEKEIKRNNLEKVKLAVECGANVNQLNSKHITPLNIAIIKGHFKIVQFLIEKGAKVNAVDSKGFTPLTVACQEGNFDIVKLLLKNNASVNSVYHPLLIAIFNGHLNIVKFFVLEVGILKKHWSFLAFAIRGGHLDIVKFLVSEKKDLIYLGDSNVNTPLDYACHKNDIDIVKFLISSGPRNWNMVVNKLHYVVKNCHIDILKLFIENGVKINKLNNSDETPLYIACYCGYLDKVEFLISSGAFVNIPDSGRMRPLNGAIRKGHLDIVKFLIKKGAEINNYCYEDDYDEFGEDNIDYSIPLLLACEKGHLEIVKILLENGANLNVCNSYGMTPLHFSSINNFIEITKVLIEKGANINKTDRTGVSALSYACENGHTEIVKILIQNNADIYNQKFFEELDGDEDNLEPIFFACRHGYLDIVKCLLNEGECNPNLKGETTNVTPLHVACQFGQFEIVKELISKGASINEIENEGFTPLHEVCAYKSYGANEESLLEIAKFLVKNNALINERTPESNFLITNNGSSKEIIRKGITPLDFAIDNGYDMLADYLKREIIWKRRRLLLLTKPCEDHLNNLKRKLTPLGGVITATITNDHNSVDGLFMQLKMKIAKFL